MSTEEANCLENSERSETCPGCERAWGFANWTLAGVLRAVIDGSPSLGLLCTLSVQYQNLAGPQTVREQLQSPI